jgi:hypothetical protein
MTACGRTGGRNRRTPWKAGAAVSSKDAFDDLRGRGRAATPRLEFLPRRFHRHDQFRPAMFRQPALEHFHERFLLLKRQPIGGIQNLCEHGHGHKVADLRTFGNTAFGGAEIKPPPVYGFNNKVTKRQSQQNFVPSLFNKPALAPPPPAPALNPRITRICAKEKPIRVNSRNSRINQ